LSMVSSSVRFIRGSMQRDLRYEVRKAWFSSKENRVAVQMCPFRDGTIRDEYYVPWRIVNKNLRIKIDWAKARTDPGYHDWVDMTLDRALTGKILPYKKLKAETKRFKTFVKKREKERGYVRLKVKFQLQATSRSQMRLYTMFKQYMEEMVVTVRGQELKPYRGVLEFEHESSTSGSLTVGANKKIINAVIAIDETLLKESWGLKVREDFKEDIGHYIEKIPFIRQILGFGEV